MARGGYRALSRFARAPTTPTPIATKPIAASSAMFAPGEVLPVSVTAATFCPVAAVASESFPPELEEPPEPVASAAFGASLPPGEPPPPDGAPGTSEEEPKLFSER